MNVSLIIPVYQVEPYIEDCLRSVMRQTYKGEMECLLIDDCGKDNSIAIAEKMIREYNEGRSKKEEGRSKKDDNLDENEGRKTKDDGGRIRFRVIRHERNRGLAAARNTGIQHATGEYLFFLDSDDWIADECIAILMERAVADPAIELVQGNTATYPYKEHDSRTKSFSLTQAINNDEVRSSLFKLDELPAFSWNKLVKKSFVLEHQLWFKEGVLYEDNLWQFHLIKHLKNVCFVQDITYIYRVRSNSIMTGTDKNTKAENLGIVYHEILNDLTKGYEKEEYCYYAKGLAKIYFRYAHASSILKDDFRICWERRKELGTTNDRAWLAVSYILRITGIGRFLTKLRKGR